MPEKIENATFFHINGVKPYGPTAMMEVGQLIEAGKATNPFFGYYEKPRMISVDFPDGRIEDFRAMQYLDEIERGRFSRGLKQDFQSARQIARQYATYVRELLMETSRLKVAPEAPSRMNCLWLAANLDDAIRWRPHVGGMAAQIVEVKVSGTIHVADERNLVVDSEPFSESLIRAERYWQGAMTDDPLVEMLFSGNATVTRIMMASGSTSPS